jgi:hypothetical protein
MTNMTEPEWKAELRRQLETAGEAQVRADFASPQQGEKIGVNLWSDGLERKRKRGSSGKIGFTGERSRLRA